MKKSKWLIFCLALLVIPFKEVEANYLTWPLLSEIKILEKSFQEEVFCLATNIYFESRGTSQTEQTAVAYVTVNRLTSGNYGKSICEIVHQVSLVQTDPSTKKKAKIAQFAWTINPALKKVKREDESWEIAQRIAYLVLSDPDHFDPTHGSTNFYDHKRVKAPVWAKKMEVAVKMEGHTYYKLKDQKGSNKY